MKILSESKKTKDSEAYGAMEGIQWANRCIYLEPGRETGTCVFSTDGCENCCIIHCGQMCLPAAVDARYVRTRLFKENRPLFNVMTTVQIARAENTARSKGRVLVMRCDGTSDTGMAERIAPNFPDVRFVDYTKSAFRYRKFLNGTLPPNWHLTFSRSEENWEDCLEFLRKRGTVAVPFRIRKGEPLPRKYKRWTTVDGDVHDLRFLDPKGVIVGLRAKGKRAWEDDTGFVVDP